MLGLLDRILDKVTMYRLLHIELISLLCVAGVFGFFHILTHSPFSILLSACLCVALCVTFNHIFAYFWKAPTNSESSYLTALIIASIVSPLTSLSNLWVFIVVCLLAIASKYIVVLKKKHIFNPAGFGVVTLGLFFNHYASWWMGTAVMAPFVLFAGFLIVRKLQKEDMLITFFLINLAAVGIFAILLKQDIMTLLKEMILVSPLIFLGSIMLTEPLTSPARKNMQLIYGGLVGFLLAPQVHIGNFYPSPEIALLIGNVFAFLVNPKQKLMLHFSHKTATQNSIDFAFIASEKLHFVPGQYMEWTLPHPHMDSRGERRYFTLASSPTEEKIHLGVKFYENSSTYKKALADLSEKETIVANALAGEFILPKEKKKKLVFIAGGIGITPFRSMIKFLLDTNEKRDIVLLYSNTTQDEIMYKDIFDAAKQNLGIKTIYVLTEIENIPKNWKGQKGRIDAKMIQKEIPDYKDRFFYLSGPHGMIVAFEKTLRDMKVSGRQIKKDYFPGYA